MSTPKINDPSPLRAAIIGGGAAGMLAAGMLGELSDCSITVFEKNRQAGRKLAITGKGRCNLTNNCTPDEFLRHVVANPRFLFGALNAFPPEATMELFEKLGVPLKTERGRRVFPVSDRAYDIVDALRAYAGRSAQFRFSCVVRKTEYTEKGFCLTTDSGTELFDLLLLATGGVSYPATGSTGDGYRFARSLGHTVVPPAASLVPIECADRALCASMMGLTLKNIALRIEDGTGKTVYSDFGELLFTHFGVSGPTVLSASAFLREDDLTGYTAILDLKPALNEAELDARLLSDLAAGQNRDLINLLHGLLPAKMCAPFAQLAGVNEHKKANSITKEERKRILRNLKHFPIRLLRLRPREEAVITAGGVSVREIYPKTMQSKRCPGLFFAGELIDCDALTGGYNLQIAFSTAAAAARGMAGCKPGNPDRKEES